MSITVIIIMMISILYWGIQLISLVLTTTKFGYLDKVEIHEPDEWPSVSVILTASNEETTLENAVRSRLEEDYPNVEFIIVEDRSTDGTPEIADRLVSEDKRVKVIHLTHLPPGWLGKLNALNDGVKASSGDWLLFSDCDVSSHKGTLKRAISHCLEGGYDHLPIIPKFDGKSPVLAAAISVFLRQLSAWGMIFRVESKRHKTALGVGAFNLVKRTAYDRTPGFEYLKMDIADDVGLGRMLKKHGAHPTILHGGDLVHLKFYHSLGEMLRASERAVYTSLGNFTWYIPFITGVAVTAMELSPFIMLLWGWKWAIIPLVFYLSATILSDVWEKRPWYSIFFQPIAAVLMAIATIRGGILGSIRKGVYWRGVFYSNEELKKGRRVSLLKLK